jgi:hypothetical protein
MLIGAMSGQGLSLAGSHRQRHGLGGLFLLQPTQHPAHQIKIKAQVVGTTLASM